MSYIFSYVQYAAPAIDYDRQYYGFGVVAFLVIAVRAILAVMCTLVGGVGWVASGRWSVDDVQCTPPCTECSRTAR